LDVLPHLMLLHDTRHGLLLGAVLGRRASAFFRRRFLFRVHARRHFRLRLGDGLLVLHARCFEHALRLVAHFVRLVARLLGDRRFLARGLADQFFGGSADLQRGFGLLLGYFALALGFFARLAFGIDALGKLGL